MYSMRDGPGARSPEAGPRLAHPQPGAIESCLRAIDRIEQMVDEESAILARNTAADLDGFARRKSHGLLELTRALRGIEPAVLESAIEPRLRPLRDRLAMNSAALRRHLEAVQEVSAVLSRAIRDADSDGTYTGTAWRGARA